MSPWTPPSIRSGLLPLLLLAAELAGAAAHPLSAQERPRAREAGVVIGIFEPGPNDAITDVGKVKVGHSTVIRGDSIRTGVTAVVPDTGDLYERPVPAWIHVGNGYGKLIGETQVREFGEIETPILLTCTLCVWEAAQALADHELSRPGQTQHTINPIVGETNDSRVNDMWAHPIVYDDVRRAVESAHGGAVEEGSVGAGEGTSAFGWKGGIGTASRVLPESLGGYTVGILVQSNFPGVLSINGAPVGRELGRYPYRKQLELGSGRAGAEPSAADSRTRVVDGRRKPAGASPEPIDAPDGVVSDFARTSPFRSDGGSIMMVLATDAPLTARNLERLARRAMLGLARTGAYAANSSGDYVIAFSTAGSVRRPRSSPRPWPQESVLNPEMSPLFAAVAEATEEAVVNSIFKATTVSGRGNTLEAIPIDRTLEVLRKYNALGWDRLRPHGR